MPPGTIRRRARQTRNVRRKVSVPDFSSRAVQATRVRRYGASASGGTYFALFKRLQFCCVQFIFFS